METKLSIIIVNWNTKMLLERCLNSIIQNSKIKNQNYEVIIVDNGSTDGSQEMVSKFKIQDSRFKIQLIENGQNLGFAKAVNIALRQAQGEAFLLLNSDTQVKPGALGKLIEFEEKVRPAVIGARMLNSDGTIQPSCFYLPTVKRAILEYWLGKKNYFSKYSPPGKEPVEVEAVSGGVMMISRAVVDKIGMLDERYFMYFEDLDYCRKAKKSGFKIYYLPEAEIVHEHGASGKNLAKQEAQWKRLVPSSKIYHGWITHYLINFILWSGQKCLKRTKH